MILGNLARGDTSSSDSDRNYDIVKSYITNDVNI